MKSLHSKSWDLREGKTIQSWKPDEIFPSLTTEGMSSVVDEMLLLFHPNKNETAAGNEQNLLTTEDITPINKPAVQKWNWETLTNVPSDDFALNGNIPGLEGIPVRIAQDEKQRRIAEAKRLAESIVSTAQKRAQELLLTAQQEVDQIRQEAYDVGRTQAIADLQKTTENAQIIIEQLNAWRKEIMQNSEPLLLEMTQKISSLLFGKGMTLDKEIMQKNLDKIIKMAGSLGDIKVYLNERDVNTLDPDWKKFQESLSNNRIQIVPSETILPGGCYIQGEAGVVDARIETQLSAIMGALNKDYESHKDSLS